MIDVRRLRVLREVAMSGSISAAASVLGYTPSAVSQQIAVLERETGTSLVQRRGRGIVLTAGAQTLVEHAHLILAQLERAEAELSAHRQRLEGTVQLAAFPTALQTFVPQAIARLVQDAPRVGVRVTDAEPDAAVAALGHGGMDLIIGHDYDLLPGPRLVALHRRDLFADPLVLIGRPLDEHATGAGAPVALASLAGERWLMPAAGGYCGQLVRRACESAGFSAEPVAVSDDFAALAALARSGLGVALVPTLALAGRGADDALQITPSLKRTVFAAVRDGSEEHPLIGALIDALVAVTVPFREA